MTSEPEQNTPNKPTTTPGKPTKPVNGVTARSNTADAWDQLRQTAESTTRKLNDFRHRNQNASDLEKTARQVAERGREETGRGLRALAEAAGKLADLIDSKSGTKGQHADQPRAVEPPQMDLDAETDPDGGPETK